LQLQGLNIEGYELSNQPIGSDLDVLFNWWLKSLSPHNFFFSGTGKGVEWSD